MLTKPELLRLVEVVDDHIELSRQALKDGLDLKDDYEPIEEDIANLILLQTKLKDMAGVL